MSSEEYYNTLSPKLEKGWIKKIMKLSELIGTGNDILNLGCSDGKTNYLFEENNTIVNLDIEPRYKKFHKNFICSDATKSFNTTEKFDVIIALDVLEHTLNPLGIINNVKKHLRDDHSIFIGSIPNFGRLKYSIPHLLGYSATDSFTDPHIRYYDFPTFNREMRLHFGWVDVWGTPDLFCKWLSPHIFFMCAIPKNRGWKQ